ncbi:anti-sigma factor [Shewanella sp. SR43-4]|jgi:sigma-E factor negative regulatory protein RseA|uniref:sigma-E factor negative regulatory protein n=1 Tax=Shewanella TaxID=22 RepID=UPI000C4B2436|nr:MULTISPECIES: anti sigma-E factor RseA C-terminal domain-containing protein [Shewanella]NCQ44644.1 anti-sigma factor [Shewanella frigidimarina]MBB1318691.1 anti-sigma factor [Shewanella sp. SR43-4]MBB1321313.1 anti-sigma factor [Shewanella sp. SR43-8]MBB1388505.1 anti-sigma factor [Shewanella sp. SG44-6]MBB1474236.1 anti-sigma factor [Shewanella sp. SG41-3]|tara:strand:- start:4240 stop:4839 length:600 start_codon:yes stop_codon:yes gene_type:complete
MLKSSQEWVSAAVDGEVDDKTLAQLSADVDSHDEWQRYHMIGDAMRGELPATIDLDLFASITAAIELEPTIIAPQAKSTEVDQQRTTASNVVPFFKQFGQYAIAATVAMVAIVGVQNYNQSNDAESPLPVLMTRPLVGSVSPVSYQTGAAQNQQSYSNEQVIEQRRRINAYIQDHMLQQRLNPGVAVDNNSVQDATVNP